MTGIKCPVRLAGAERVEGSTCAAVGGCEVAAADRRRTRQTMCFPPTPETAPLAARLYAKDVARLTSVASMHLSLLAR